MTKSKRRNILEWALLLGIPALLYITGLHTEVIGKVQQLALSTGIVKPNLSRSTENVMDGELYSFALEGNDGKPFLLESYKGKVVFMNFWATWCPPCIAEMPGIDALYKDTSSNDIVFLMISIDEDFSKAERFVEKKNYSFPVFKVRGQIPTSLRSKSIPATFIISPDGSIAASHIGMADYNNAKVRNFLKDLVEQWP